MSSSSYCGMQNENSRNMGFYEKGFLGVIFRFALLVASYYLNINWQKNPIHLKIIWFLFEVFYGVLLLPLMCAVKATRSCVDFVLYYLSYFHVSKSSLSYQSCLLVLILSLNYFKTENEKSRNMGFYEKGFLGVVFRCDLLVAT